MYITKQVKKVIAVNLDQTLAHSLESLVLWHNDIYGTQFSVKDFNTYEYWKIWGGSKEESCMKIRNFYNSDYFDQIKPIRDFALEALKMLKRRHFTLVIITSRQQFVAEKTKKFVDRHYPGIFESIYFCNLNLSEQEQLEYVSKPKSVICQEIGVDVLIDDCLEHAFDCSTLGINVLLYDFKGKYIWNHDQQQQQQEQPSCQQYTTPILENVHRMFNWKDIIAQFPKPSSPLRFCHFTDEEDDEEEEDSIGGESFDLPVTSHYGGYETVEVEMSDEEEQEQDYPLWKKDNRVWV